MARELLNYRVSDKAWLKDRTKPKAKTGLPISSSLNFRPTPRALNQRCLAVKGQGDAGKCSPGP